MFRIAVAFVAAFIGGVLAGCLDWLFTGFVPNGETRWAFYAIFGIPVYLVLSVFLAPFAYLMMPDRLRDWPRLMRTIFSTLVWCAFFFTTLFTSINLKS